MLKAVRIKMRSLPDAYRVLRLLRNPPPGTRELQKQFGQQNLEITNVAGKQQTCAPELNSPVRYEKQLEGEQGRRMPGTDGYYYLLGV